MFLLKPPFIEEFPAMFDTRASHHGFSAVSYLTSAPGRWSIRLYHRPDGRFSARLHLPQWLAGRRYTFGDQPRNRFVDW